MMRLACYVIFSGVVSAQKEISLQHITPNVDVFSISDLSKVWYTALSSSPPFKQQYKKANGDWQDDLPQPLSSVIILPLYINLEGVGQETTAGKCELNDNISKVGCFPWKPENSVRGEEFKGIPDFDEMIKDNGQEVTLLQPSPDSCERRCGNYKYFGLRMVGNDVRCWCLSDVRMPRLLSVFEKKPDENLNNAKCNNVCSGCTGASSSTTRFCGSTTHTWIYLRRAQRQLIVLDMSGSMSTAPFPVQDESSCKDGTKTFGATEPQMFCISPFKMDWGTKVLRCLLDKGKKRANSTGIFKISNSKSSSTDGHHSKRLYDYTEGFSDADEVIDQWTPEGGTYLWEYLSKEVLNVEKPENVNNGKLEIVLFSDGQDNGSNDPFYGGSGFVHLMNELAKKHMYPRFRIVCLDGRDLGCRGYREYAVSTGGSYANFESQDGWLDRNTREWKKFCGEASANFETVSGACPLDFFCSDNNVLKTDGQCEDVKQCTVNECCTPKPISCPTDFACGNTMMLKTEGQCKDPSQCTSAECCVPIPGPCSAHFSCGNTTAFKTNGQCKNKSQCTAAECCDPIPGPCPANFVCGNTTALKADGQCKDKSQCTAAECCDPIAGICPADICATGTFGAKNGARCADASACTKTACCEMQGACSKSTCIPGTHANANAANVQCRVPGSCTIDECCAGLEDTSVTTEGRDAESEAGSASLVAVLIAAGVLLLLLACFVLGLSKKKRKKDEFDENRDARGSNTAAPTSTSVWLNPTPVAASSALPGEDAKTLRWDDDGILSDSEDEKNTGQASGVRQRKSKADSQAPKPLDAADPLTDLNVSKAKSIADLRVSKPHSAHMSAAHLNKSRPHGVHESRTDLRDHRPRRKKANGEPTSPPDDSHVRHHKSHRKRRDKSQMLGQEPVSVKAVNESLYQKERKRQTTKTAKTESTTIKDTNESLKARKKRKRHHEKTAEGEPALPRETDESLKDHKGHKVHRKHKDT